VSGFLKRFALEDLLLIGNTSRDGAGLIGLIIISMDIWGRKIMREPKRY
ncbi:unnamed protein product, partial [marine sediment metagenome]